MKARDVLCDRIKSCERCKCGKRSKKRLDTWGDPNTCSAVVIVDGPITSQYVDKVSVMSGFHKDQLFIIPVIRCFSRIDKYKMMMCIDWLANEIRLAGCDVIFSHGKYAREAHISTGFSALKIDDTGIHKFWKKLRS